MNNIIVTTGDLDRPYDVLGPVYFQVSNKGLFSSTLSRLKTHYWEEIQRMKSNGTMSQFKSDWGFLYGEYSVGQNDFEAAFFVATQELKKRAKLVGADAVICMRQDIDLDTEGFCYFYLQMYGTAVKFREPMLTFAQRYEQAEDMMSQGNFEEAESIYFQLGDFRDSKEKAKAAYAAYQSTTYNRAEELMGNENYQEAEKLYASLRDYQDSKEKAEQAHLAHEEWKAKLSSSFQTPVDSTQNAKRSWTCPNCGKENPHFIFRCTCGTSR